jgi:hypothetical protein
MLNLVQFPSIENVRSITITCVRFLLVSPCQLASAALLAVVATAAFPATPNVEPVYRALRDAPIAETFLVENIVLKRDNGILTLKSGTIGFTPKTMGRDTVAVFSGEGTFFFQPVSPIEKNRLESITGVNAVLENFDRALLCFTDRTGDEIRSQAHTVPPDAKLSADLRDFRKRLRSRPDQPHSLLQSLLTSEDIDNVEADLLADLYNTAQAGFFSAYLHGKHFSGLRFHVKPRGALPALPAPEEVAVIDYDPEAQQEGIWNLEHLKREIDAHQVSSDENKRVVQALSYKIETTIARNDQFTASANLRFKAVSAGDRVIKFGLIPSLRVSRVSSGGQDVPFIQEGRREDASFYVVMPRPMEAGSEHEIAIEYESEKGALQGDRVVTKEGGGNFSVGARESWYPSLNSFRDHAQYDLTFKVPKQYTLVSVGKLEKSWTEKDFACTHWVSEVPMPVAGFNYGAFRKKEITDSATGIHIEGYAASELPDYLMGASNIDGVGTLSPSALNDQIIVEAQNSMRLFTQWFGKSEFGRIAITQQPAFDYGQSWPTLVYLPFSAYLDDTQRWRLFNSIQHGLTEFVDEVTPHEVSHQWWGHMVGWTTLHDQWLSEGFAFFSAGIYLQATEKSPRKYLDYWDHARRAIVDKNNFGRRANDAGPVWLGILLNSARNGGAYDSVVYRKGGYILHMLRSMMYDSKTGDAAFIAMMHDFVQQHMNGNATTESFQRVVEKHVAPGFNVTGDGKMDWFFSEWVYGTSLPHYKFDYTLEPQPDGKCLLKASLTQSEVSDSFVMLVPMYADFDGTLARLGTIRIAGNKTLDNLKVMLPKKPTKAMINALHDVLEQ